LKLRKAPLVLFLLGAAVATRNALTHLSRTDILEEAYHGGPYASGPGN